jgi:hypothetical protein
MSDDVRTADGRGGSRGASSVLCALAARLPLAARLLLVATLPVATALGLMPGPLAAQPPGFTPPPPQSPREAAPVDLTGQWVAVVSEDWRWRMVTPARGDFASIPLNAEGVRVGLEWDPEADTEAGLECKAYGAPAIMRRPGRVRIAWEDDETLLIETDSGTQTRRLHFDAPATTNEQPSRQGYSVANWEGPLRGEGSPEAFTIFSRRIGTEPQSLEVRTTNLLPGYYRKNGPPYSADAVVEEYFDYHAQPNGDEWFTVTTVITDPTYLDGIFVTSSDFKKEPGGDGWNPTPCTAR